MAYHWSLGDIHTRQHRSSTAPALTRPPFSAIPPSLIPGHRRLSATTTLTNGLLYSDPGTGNQSMVKIPATFTPVGDAPEYYSINPSPYHDVQPPPPPLPLPLPLPQSLLPQPVVPPLPPKAVIMSPTTTPTLPPKPPSFMPAPPTAVLRPTAQRSKSQPPSPITHGSPPPLYAPPLPPPPILPPKPLGARSPSLSATSSPVPQPKLSPRAKPSLIAKGPPDTNGTASLTLPSANSPGSLGMKEEEELELALELSVHTGREHANALLSHDEDLARALEQSLLDPAPRPVPKRSRLDRLVVDSEPAPSSSSAKPWDAHPRSPKTPKTVSRVPTLSPVDVQLKEDEAFARRLYDSERTTPTSETTQEADPQPSEHPPLPRYADIVGGGTAAAKKHLGSDATASPHIPQALPTSRSHERLFIPDQANIPRRTPSPAQRISPRPVSQALTASPEDEEAPELPPTSSPSARQLYVTPSHFIEPELLYGASFGFQAPPVENFEMRGSLPEIIALPYGKAPPMHIRASSWRQLLKLMAKLSATQIEPSVEAVAATKGDLYLRTVIQFFKVHQTSSDWRTVIYLTIDYPPPPDHRSTNGDVNALPYSYGLSTLPALLRDGRESQLSKYYTIQATSRTPLPKLPISMPDMAMYLTSALEDSRRALGDSSSGLRKLAKMVDQFYPNQQGQGAAGEEERRGGGRAFIGRLMGRTSRPRPQGGRNAEVYDLVTPFVSNEWG